MNPTLYNKPTLGGTFPFAASSQQPLGVACNSMDWKEIFTYDAATGNLIWKHRDRSHFKTDGLHRAWNEVQEGKVAGSPSYRVKGGRSCVRVCVFYRPTTAHLIIWEMHYGPIPQGMEVDHRDGDPWNNRLSNLRVCTHQHNTWNCRPRKNESGLKGAQLNRNPRSKKRWVSSIRVKDRTIHLGSFSTKEEAHAAYCEAAKKHHGEFARIA